MPSNILDQVVDFYQMIFSRLFSDPFQRQIKDRLQRNQVVRQIEGVADAASQSLTRLFSNQRLDEDEVVAVLAGLGPVADFLKLDDLANANLTPETMVPALLEKLHVPESVSRKDREALYRIALHSLIQTLMYVGPVLAEWQKLNFSSAFELPRRVIDRLNQISGQLDTFGQPGAGAADQRYEVIYRDYLLQRFYRVEAGTVRMTTNMDVDLRELFVMPQVKVRHLARKTKGGKNAAQLMDLAEARRLYGSSTDFDAENSGTDEDTGNSSALEQVKRFPRLVIVGIPGSGKSTFLEWLQLQLAAVEEEMILAGAQAIPLLLRVRQLDPLDLPTGAALIERATASRDRADIMPYGWIERQLDRGRLVLIVDGLDEVEPGQRDAYILPWLIDLCRRYPKCRYIVSSRPVGYPPSTLKTLKFAECDLLDFGREEIEQYTRHWCTAIRLARNEPSDEARREGASDGASIVKGFKDHPYIRNLAQNPLMLSAVCLVNYFEHGQLPKDRALLYKLCVEGLLHVWDQRRGIRSAFGLEEKMSACRELALAMQTADRAEIELALVEEILTRVFFDDSVKARQFLEHIRHRSGLLLERRYAVFAFAHLTFQEYLAARAVYEGNSQGVDVARIASQYRDGRWNEVTALYCGMASATAARRLLELLIAQPTSAALSPVLAEAYLSAGPELARDRVLRKLVLERLARAPAVSSEFLDRFPSEEIAEIANDFVGTVSKETGLSGSYRWLFSHPKHINLERLVARYRMWKQLKPMPLSELVYLFHAHGSTQLGLLAEAACHGGVYKTKGPTFQDGTTYMHQAEIALMALEERFFSRLSRNKKVSYGGVAAVALPIWRVLATHGWTRFGAGEGLLSAIESEVRGQPAIRREFASLSRKIVTRAASMPKRESGRSLETRLSSWATLLEMDKSGATDSP